MGNVEREQISLVTWYNNYALEVKLHDDESFLTILETLERMGVSSNKAKRLYQSCHLLFKQNRYFVVHFKELFAIDGRAVDLSVEDIGRRNTIACLLEEWGLLEILDHEKVNKNRLPVSSIKVIKHKDKPDYELITKYQIGNIKKRR